ncbi:MAG: hypothetical protein FJZ00_08090 [Candidatus Sericytochromatia bacterium]|uniref:Uncharacterized protein n=1 Tax=Candidatus Tanganyikabacteria bacterium TaxID=2961651 RepID=A0A937X6J8_9BACT|nr:hypothetical protein [Candidatus Tanganyikabacteria bacterium]
MSVIAIGNRGAAPRGGAGLVVSAEPPRRAGGRDAYLPSGQRPPAVEKPWWALSTEQRRLRTIEGAKETKRRSIAVGLVGAGIGLGGAALGVASAGSAAGIASIAALSGGSVVLIAAACWGMAEIASRLASR